MKFTTNRKIQFSLGEEPPESSGDIQLPPKTPAASPTPSPKEVSTDQDQGLGSGSGSGSGSRIRIKKSKILFEQTKFKLEHQLRIGRKKEIFHE